MALLGGNRQPQTLVRLSQSLGLLAFQQVDDSGNPLAVGSNPINWATTASSLKFIGATSRFKVTQEREIHPRRGIGNIEPWANVPGNVTTHIELEKVMLNTEDALGAFQFMPGNIAFQTRPLVIVETNFPALGDNGLPITSTIGGGQGGLLDRAVSRVAKGQWGKSVEAVAKGVWGAAGGANGLASVGQIVNNLLGSISTLIDLAKSPTYTGCWISSRTVEYKLEGSQAVVENLSLTVARVSPVAGILSPTNEYSILQNLPVVTRGVQLARSLVK